MSSDAQEAMKEGGLDLRYGDPMLGQMILYGIWASHIVTVQLRFNF